jgi:hypothetical protein
LDRAQRRYYDAEERYHKVHGFKVFWLRTSPLPPLPVLEQTQDWLKVWAEHLNEEIFRREYRGRL